MPALICGSFSDNNLHSRGSFRGWERISSADRFLYTHRSGKWATFYSPPARAAQLKFFDRYLRGHGRPGAAADQARGPGEPRRHPVREEEELAAGPHAMAAAVPNGRRAGRRAARRGRPDHVRHQDGGACWEWTAPADTELTGPMALRLWVEARGTDDVDLFAGVEKWRGRSYVPFEGSYGFGRDRITTGWLKASLRALDEASSRPFDPVPACTRREPLAPGQVVAADIALGPSATLFRAGETLRLVVAGRWLWPHNPFTGQFPAAYEPSPRGLHPALGPGPPGPPAHPGHRRAGDATGPFGINLLLSGWPRKFVGGSGQGCGPGS